MNKRWLWLGALALWVLWLLSLGTNAHGALAQPLTEVKVMLDWTPNTNHTGLFVAQEKGYFAEAGLNVQLLPPGDTLVEQIVGLGTVNFGVSYAESLTYSRANDLPVVSIAAVIQHNTSGFAAIQAQHRLKTPGDLNGLRYGAFGSPLEQPMLEVLITCTSANAANVQMINVGYVDPLPLLERDQIDFVWLFYGWDGIRAELAGLTLDTLMLKDYTQCVPDYYTPILITNEAMITTQPEVVRAFVAAAARGYAFAIENPAEAADLLLKAAPDLDPALVRASAAWLATQYQADAPRWGEQRREVWAAFVGFMLKHKLIEGALEVDSIFTNDFLPGQ